MNIQSIRLSSCMKQRVARRWATQAVHWLKVRLTYGRWWWRRPEGNPFKTIWLVNENASTPDIGYGGRHYYLAAEMARRGYKVYLIGSSGSHLLRRRPLMRSAYELVPVEGFTFVWVRMPVYGSAHSWRRAISWFLFSWRLGGLCAVIPHPPDVILYSSPSPIGFLGSHWLARRHGARLVYEMRDLWPMTLVELGGYSPRHPMIRFMQRVEDKAFRESDRVVSNLANAVQRLCGNLQVDISKARSLLGWVQPVSVEEGLRRAVGGGGWEVGSGSRGCGTRLRAD